MNKRYIVTSFSFEDEYDYKMLKSIDNKRKSDDWSKVVSLSGATNEEISNHYMKLYSDSIRDMMANDSKLEIYKNNYIYVTHNKYVENEIKVYVFDREIDKDKKWIKIYFEEVDNKKVPYILGSCEESHCETCKVEDCKDRID